MRESENCSHNCRECGSDCAERREPQSFLEEPNAGTHVKKVIGIVSGKGGVGKSLATSLLASAMQKKGYRCAVLDADITGPSIPRMFGIRKKAVSNETGILPAETKDGMKIMSVNLLLEQELVGMIVGKAVKMAEMLHIPVIGIVENMAYFQCPSCHEKHFIFGESHVKQTAAEYGIGMTAQIPIEPRLASVCDSGSIADFEAGWLSGLAEGIEAGGGKK